MTLQQIEALKLALEALKNYAWHGETCPQHPTYSEPKNYPKCTCGYAKVIPALEEALAEHAMQEVQRLGQEIEQKIGCVNHDCDQCKAPPEQEPVAWVCHGADGKHDIDFYQDEIDAIPVTTMLYTTPPQRTEQEPVAWMDADGNVSDNNDHKCFPIPLYTQPPQRTWANLPDEEIKILWIQYRAALPRYLCFAKALLARAKEENT